MARGQEDTSTTTVSVPRDRQLSTDAARTRLYQLVNKMSRLRKGEASLLKRAIEVGPRGKGGALLIPTVDVEAMLDQVAEREDQIEALQDEIEDFSLAQLVGDRRAVPEDELLTVEELAASVGRSHLVEQE